MNENINIEEVFKQFKENVLTDMDDEKKQAYIVKYLYALLRS